MAAPNIIELTANIKAWGLELGFQQVGITDVDLGDHEARLEDWLRLGFQADMSYMARHGKKRSRPDVLVPGTTRIISVRMDYLHTPSAAATSTPGHAYVARYALGRDYHKVIRARLRTLELRINAYVEQHRIQDFVARVFTDSAPVLEKAIAQKAGLGWIGKNTMLVNENAGSWFFLGELFTNIPLITDGHAPVNRCGSCTSCLDVCPTGAIVEPYRLDARMCISYHTIENRGGIPESIRKPMGNRIFGCDDCQVTCPWNRYARPTAEPDFAPRNNLDSTSLLELYAWSEQEFDARTCGSAIRRAGYDGWLRNISVALGNADFRDTILAALKRRLLDSSALVSEHVAWAIGQQQLKQKQIATE